MDGSFRYVAMTTTKGATAAPSMLIRNILERLSFSTSVKNKLTNRATSD